MAHTTRTGLYIRPTNTNTHTHTLAHTRTHTHTHARTHAHTHMHTRTHAHTHTYARTHAHTHTRTHAHTNTHALAHARTCTHTHMNTHATAHTHRPRTHAHTHTRAHTHTHTQTHTYMHKRAKDPQTRNWSVVHSVVKNHVKSLACLQIAYYSSYLWHSGQVRIFQILPSAQSRTIKYDLFTKFGVLFSEGSAGLKIVKLIPFAFEGRCERCQF